MYFFKFSQYFYFFALICMPFYLDKTRKNYFFCSKIAQKYVPSSAKAVPKYFKDILTDKDLLNIYIFKFLLQTLANLGENYNFNNICGSLY